MYQWKWHNFLHLVITPAGGALGQSLSPLNLSLLLSQSWPWSPYYCWLEIGGQSDGRKLDKRHPRGHFFSSSTPVGSYPPPHHQGSAEKDEDLKHYLKKTLHDTLFLGWTVVVYVLTYTIQFSFKLQTLFAMQVSGHHQIWGQLFAGASFFYKVHVS